MKKIIFIIMLSLIVLGCISQNTDSSPIVNDVSVKEMMKEKVIVDDKIMEVTEAIRALMGSTEFEFVGSLSDVTGGVSSGTAFSVFANEKYLLKVDIRDLPDPDDSHFYEGWIVRRGIKFNVISTGKVEGENGVYINRYASEKDLTDHTFYVLTLEPDDGNPAPAEHVLEGTLEPIIK